MSKRRLIGILCVCIALMLFVCSCVKEADTIGDDIFIGGVDVSGLPIQEARFAVEKECAENVDRLEYTVIISQESTTYTATELGVKYDVDSAMQNALALADENPENNSSRKIDVPLVVDIDTAKRVFSELIKKHSYEPTPPSVEYSDGEISVTEGTDGVNYDIETLTAAIEDAVKTGKSETITIDGTVKPSATAEEIANLQQNYVQLSEYTTYFDKNPYNAKNRVNNIIKAAGLVDGARVKAGKEFNTNDCLGDRNGENGWYKAPGISDGKYRMEYGGGICQVSSTLYNAALLANLEIVERKPHSIPVGYVPLGRDATISTGGPNLIIGNNTDGEIIISVLLDYEVNAVTVRIFGIKSDEYDSIEIVSEQTGTIQAPEAEVIVDRKLKAGERRVDRKARNGKKAVTYRYFYDKDGNEIFKELVSEDIYRAIPARVYVGE